MHSGLLQSRYLISSAFLAIVGAMGYELSSDVAGAARLTRQLQAREAALCESEQYMRLAADAAGLAMPVSIVGRIGSDAFGSLVDQWIAAFATRQSLAVASRPPTTSVVGQIFKNRERSFLYAAGASAEFCSADIDLEQEKAQGARALHLGYALLLPALDGEPMLTLLRQANQLGLLVSLDVALFS